MPLKLIEFSALSGTEAVRVRTGALATSKQTPLLTQAAFNCIIILLHADGAGGALAHLPPDTDEAPVLGKMVAFLEQRGASAAQVQVLLGGAAIRSMQEDYNTSLREKLTDAGLREENVTDARVAPSGKEKRVIGTDAQAQLRGVFYEPTTGQAAPLLLEKEVTEKGKSSSVKTYQVDSNGAVSATGGDSQCVIL